MRAGILRIVWTLVVVWAFALTACSSSTPPGLAVPASAEDLQGQSYDVVVEAFRGAGFTNIETEILDDLITGWLTKDGEVERVAINADTTFAADDRFPGDSRVVVTYHTFPEEEPEGDIEATPGPGPTETPDQSNESAPQSPSSTPAAPEAVILTAQNDPDLAAVLKSHRVNDVDAHRAFANSHKGKTIEFDGTIAFSMRHGNAKTRFDFLIYQGDFDDPQPTPGPSFAFVDVNYYDLKLAGSDIPESVGEGLDVTVTATVVRYVEDGAYIELEPVTTEVR